MVSGQRDAHKGLKKKKQEILFVAQFYIRVINSALKSGRRGFTYKCDFQVIAKDTNQVLESKGGSSREQVLAASLKRKKTRVNILFAKM